MSYAAISNTLFSFQSGSLAQDGGCYGVSHQSEAWQECQAVLVTTAWPDLP